MAQLPLLGGFYRTKSVIAGAQRCLNLFPEKNRADAPFPYTFYLTPGLSFLAQGPVAPVRAEYTASDGSLWVVIGNGVYWADSAFSLHFVGSIGTAAGPVAFKDNRLVLLLTDGTANGWAIDFTATKAMSRINGAGAFFGSLGIDFLDTFFLFVKPNSNIWYISLAEVTYANMIGGPAETGSITAGGTGYSDGIYIGVPATGGAGDSATLNLTVSAGIVTQAAIGTGGENYKAGDVLSVANTSLGGQPTAGTIAGGTGYSNGSHAGIVITGGNGTGGIATIVVSGGIVTSVTFTAGSGFLAGDVLSASTDIGTGTGFTYTVTTTTTSGSGFSYTLATVGSSAFDPLDFVALTGSNDGISGLKVVNRQIWIYGDRAYGEIWYNAGTPDFVFGRVPGIAFQHGNAATYSIAQWDLLLFWLGQDNAGDQQVFMGVAYEAKVISPPWITAALQSNGDVSDAIGFIYQENGHVFYVLTFPSADATWVYDLDEKEWHERCWQDDLGNEHRIRANCQAFAYGKCVVGDWQNGKLYEMSTDYRTDDGDPIMRRRGFSHVTNERKRLSVPQLVLNMAVGQSVGTTTDDPPMISVRASTTQGASWHNPRRQSIGSSGQYGTDISFRQFGIGRTWDFEVFWDGDFETALNGGYFEAVAAGT